MIQVFSVSGKLVKTLSSEIINSGFRDDSIVWDGFDDFGDKLGKGVYIYRVTLKSKNDGSNAEKFEKTCNIAIVLSFSNSIKHIKINEKIFVLILVFNANNVSQTTSFGENLNITSAVPFLTISPDSRAGSMGRLVQLHHLMFILFIGIR